MNFCVLEVPYLKLFSTLFGASYITMMIVGAVFVLLYTLLSLHDIIPSLAISFLASYMAIWVELLESYIDTLYMWAYEKIYANGADCEITASATSSDKECSLSNMRQEESKNK